MSHEFMGQQFDSAKDWAAEFPAFGRYFWKYVVAGAKTPTELEVMSRQAMGSARKKLKTAKNPMRAKTARNIA